MYRNWYSGEVLEIERLSRVEIIKTKLFKEQLALHKRTVAKPTCLKRVANLDNQSTVTRLKCGDEELPKK